MEQQYLIDTNAAIDYLHNRLPSKGNYLIDTHKINLSVITRMELLVWKKATSEQLKLLHGFINCAVVYNLEEQTIVQAIEIRKNYKIPLPDAIIAATALVYNFHLVTRNIADFKEIKSLVLINPWD